MISVAKRLRIHGSGGLVMFMLLSLLFVSAASYAQNKVMGEIELAAATRTEKHAGIWIDGQYVGYVDELKGSKKLLLLPGEHEIVARMAGYKEFSEKVTVEPDQKQVIRISLPRDPEFRIPLVTGEVKLNVTPSRAAVFIDDRYIGPVEDFGGRNALLISPGKHRIKVALAGYQTFEGDVNVLANQKVTVKTDLVKGSITQAGPLIKEQ